LKAILALEHDLLPASLHFDTPRPDIPFAELNLAVAGEGVGLASKVLGKPRFAGISGFGFGGTNAHVIIADAEPDNRTSPRALRAAASERERRTLPEFFAISAATPGALQSLAARYKDLLSEPGAPEPDRVAAAIGHARDPLPERLVVLGTSRDA